MMTVDELARTLKEMYDRAPYREKNARITLFGIKYSHQLSRVRLADVISRSGVNRRCEAEINIGRQLAKYVDLKPSYEEKQ